MALTKLTVDFVPKDSVAYSTSESTYLCMTLTACSTWKPANSVSWQNLPVSKFVMFYTTDTCRTAGKFYYISEVGQVNGTHSFRSPQAIRSFMIGENDYGRRPSFIRNACNYAMERVFTTDDENNSMSSNEITWITGGLSTNWSDPVPT
ncbi:hypothetical protein PHYSODRAFT_500422 [Phytophthora sojae]|uniref:Uncharacterized protein n=1 Tax=Phytophthora sojae (strain P6497) TaxID=1094619 RepID=G4ZHZ6_PHYSP|nr:hypothetical protein PHYSODRAFT_501516 [Phytophthora sojae]XP_009526697.1 hypothetical protein PHYSODRAFT_500422 [Phytophthora sojae]EGZ17635.1 hypothetical protein PHYSODRAFT_501516 [Phytophthora sojae]EGZ17639.1 hypothetical protein PHYSODRAFT_500422 [Phytophthora sojae]|eukprot:XP_009526693.1 hypothetical protein PHYSODRAFT_501516 [Phytophthora sojae]